MSTFELKNIDCLEYIKTMPDNSVDLIFGDPPYNLSSEVYIDKLTGKPDLKKANDFMNKWAGLDGEFLEEFYKQAYRILKYGGHCLLFGIDRQLFMFEYYANLSGFTQKQSLYWYFISNFPKASDLSKNLDKYFGAKREVIVENTKKTTWNNTGVNLASNGEDNRNITAPSTSLAKKYEGIKYSVAPLKQTNETIMVFQKPYKTGSCLHDVLAMENGDETITCGGIDIEGNRIEITDTETDKRIGKIDSQKGASGNLFESGKNDGSISTYKEGGRFPAQTYIDSGTAEIIDLQSGKMGMHPAGNKKDVEERDYNASSYKFGTFKHNPNYHNDTKESAGKASRILHKCDFEAGDYDLYNYCPKVSKSERNEGLEGFEEKLQIMGNQAIAEIKRGNDPTKTMDKKSGISLTKNQNNHPTVKPKTLLSKILKLFKTPNNQVLLDPFMGSGSMGISAIETGFNYIGTELDSEYFEIAKSRVEKAYYSNNVEIKNDIIDLLEYRPRGESQLRFFK